MIKVNTAKGAIYVEVKGSVIELAADTGMILQGIYDGIKQIDEFAAKEFKHAILVYIAENRVML